MNNVMKILKGMFIAIVVVVLLCNTYLLGSKLIFNNPYPKLFGYSSAVVLSGSMEDTISVNDVVIIKEEDSYGKGDIISYHSEGMFVTHRIVKETKNGYITKGDANNTDDGEILKDNVQGKVVKVIPKVGSVVHFIKTPLGMLLSLICLFIIYKLPVVGVKREEVLNE